MLSFASQRKLNIGNFCCVKFEAKDFKKFIPSYYNNTIYSKKNISFSFIQPLDLLFIR